MKAIARPDAPSVLCERCAEWTQRWIDDHRAGRKFHWPSTDGKALNQVLLPPLLVMTHEHCAYCDGLLGDTSPETIDHFRPKATFPEHAFDWLNLFAACSLCQKEKGTRWDSLALKPDAADYAFSRYFVCDAESGTLEPNPAASAADQARAQATIRLLGLNSGKRPRCRKHWWDAYRDARACGKDIELDDYPHRFFIEALEACPQGE